MNVFTNEKLDTITTEAFNGFHEGLIREHWMNLIGREQLNQNETVRLVVMPGPNSQIAKTGKIATGGWADTERISSPDELLRRMTVIQGTDTPGEVGFALSAGVYDYVPQKSPNFTSLKYIQNMIIDVDAHINETTKDRFNLTTIRPDYIKYSGLLILNYINSLLHDNGIPNVTPVYTAVTGGGFQFGVRFDKPLDKDDGKKVFETFGAVLGFEHINALSNKQNSDQNRINLALKEQEQNNKILRENALIDSELTSNNGKIANVVSQTYNADENLATNGSDKIEGLDVIKRKKGMSVQIKSFFGEWFMPFLELDNSFKDVTHAQRIPGTINQKYSAFAYIDKDIISGNNLMEMLSGFEQEIWADPLLNDARKENHIKHYKSVVHKFKQDLLNKNPDMTIIPQPTEAIKALSGIVQYANSRERLIGSEFITLSEAEKQILNALGEKDKVKEVLSDLGIEVVKDSSSYIACRSPFRTDSKPSLAVYVNNNRANIKDFTENKTYNLITLWMEVNGVSKTEAIESLAFKYNIKIDKADKRELVKIQNTDSVFELIKLINTEDYVYYRLAYAPDKCMIKNIKTGKANEFKGYKMMADHVLRYQLKKTHPDPEFMKTFQEAFLQYVMIDAFEDFLPGGQKTYEEDYIQFVNVWTTSENYLKCWEESVGLMEMTIEESLELIKSVCPTIYVFLLQITQKGDLHYFINWLNTLAKFQYGPVIPIFPSIEGAGKNLFANRILSVYLNKNYIHIVNGNAIQSNFNSFMGHANLIIADEGDFTGSREFDQLKLLSGNDTVRVEKKGVDAQTVDKRFNMCMFTNGSEPVRHPITDRRCVYYKLEYTLEATLTKLGYKSINAFNALVDSEVHKFWGIIIKTKLNNLWANHNIKNGIYHNQILLMHPFGKLVLKMVENKWTEISLQLNEKQKELQDEKTNMILLQDIQNKFLTGEPLPLITINKYLDAMSWKSTTSIQEFITKNKLQTHGINIIVESDSIKIGLDAEKLQKFIFQENNLSLVIPEFSVGEIKSLEKLREETSKEKETILEKSMPKNNFANTHSVSPQGVITKKDIGGIPGMAGIGGLNGLPPIDPNLMNIPGGIPIGLPSGIATELPKGI